MAALVLALGHLPLSDAQWQFVFQHGADLVRAGLLLVFCGLLLDVVLRGAYDQHCAREHAPDEAWRLARVFYGRATADATKLWWGLVVFNLLRLGVRRADVPWALPWVHVPWTLPWESVPPGWLYSWEVEALRAFVLRLSVVQTLACWASLTVDGYVWLVFACWRRGRECRRRFRGVPLDPQAAVEAAAPPCARAPLAGTYVTWPVGAFWVVCAAALVCDAQQWAPLLVYLSMLLHAVVAPRVLSDSEPLPPWCTAIRFGAGVAGVVWIGCWVGLLDLGVRNNTLLR